MAEKDDLQKKAQELRDQLIELHKKSGLPGDPINFAAYGPAIRLQEELLSSIVEFRDSQTLSLNENEKPDPYLIFGIFGQYLVDQIEQSPDSSVVKKSFDFVNHAYNDTNDLHIRTMLGTEIFENLTISNQVINVAKKYLEGDALNQLGKALT